LNIPGIFTESDWFWTFSISIYERQNPTPVASKRWAISHKDAPTLAIAAAVIERHVKEESRLQSALRPNRWVASFPMDETPEINLWWLREYWRGEQVARGSMLRSKVKKTDPVEFQLSLW